MTSNCGSVASSEKRQYVPGEPLRATAHITNVGDVPAALTPVLTVKDHLGNVVAAQPYDEFSLPAGVTQVHSYEWQGNLADGSYVVELTILNSERVVGGASALITVLAGSITGLETPAGLTVGEEGLFSVSFTNYGLVAVDALVSLTLQDNEGSVKEGMLPQAIHVEPDETAAAVFAWTPINAVYGMYRALGSVADYCSILRSRWSSTPQFTLRRINATRRKRVWRITGTSSHVIHYVLLLSQLR